MENKEIQINSGKYTSYRVTELTYIKVIPEHWLLEKGKWLFVEQDRPVQKEDDIVTCFRNGQVTLRMNRKTDGFTNALKEHGYQGIRKGDLVIHNMDAFAGAIGVSDSDGKSTPVYSVCTPREKFKVNAFYYAHFLRDLAKNGFIESLAKGIRERSTDFRFNDFGAILFPVPPLEEQIGIVAFLDRKTAQIEKAVSIKEKQIELLKERRQILIHHTVTRGLNPNVKMKDSGVEWIGEIPEHWEVTSVKHVLEIPICDGPHTTPQLYDEGIPFISAEAIKNGEVDFAKMRGYISLKDHQLFSKKYSAKRNDIYMVKSGATTGNVAMVNTDIEFSIWSPLAVFRADQKKVIPTYLHNYLESPSFKIGVELSWSYGTQQNIGMGILSNLPIAYPDTEEQLNISEYVSRVKQKTFSAISIKEKEIEKLKEYKATLINSAVTGKIKVSM